MHIDLVPKHPFRINFTKDLAEVGFNAKIFVMFFCFSFKIFDEGLDRLSKTEGYF